MQLPKKTLRLFLPLLLCLAPALARAQGADWIRANYTKYEYRIPMRDGVKLFTSVYVPKDVPAEKLPILLTRTPYSVAPYGPDQFPKTLGPSEPAAKEKFIFVGQDVRGRMMSEGEFVNMRPYLPKKGARDVDETTDTWDTIDWLVKNVAGNNGKVGQYGISYPGYYATMGMIDAHPALKASSPQAPIADWFEGDDFGRHGAFFLPHAFNFFASFGVVRKGPTTKWSPRFEHGTPDGYRYFLNLPPLETANEKLFEGKVPFWDELMAHDTYDDYWKARNVRPHLRGIKPAVMVVGGWFDAENLFGALETFKGTRRQSPETTATLVMGPWVHGGWSRGDGDALGAVKFGDKTSLPYREKVELAFFNHHLKGKGDWKSPAAYVFETGTNQWRTYGEWPPKAAKAKTLYFGPNGTLSFEAPRESSPAFDEYPSDPAKPVPFINEVAIGMSKEYMVADQRFASTRPDVLVYESAVLEEDLTLAGPLSASLFASTTGTDSDFVVKLIDVYPNDLPDPDPNPSNVKLAGYQQLVRGDIFRGRFRNSLEKPEAFEPGKPAKVAWNLPDVNHVFRRGHRVMVQIQSSWFPIANRNPQRFVKVTAAKPEDFQKATQRVFRSKDQPSGLGVLVLE